MPSPRGLPNKGSYQDSEYRPIGLLYHYTSLSAFKNIVESRCLWASCVHYLNDAQESRLGLQQLRDLAFHECAASSGDDKAFLEYLLPWLEDHHSWLHQVFVLCFTEARDQLSQWRGYTPHGTGVCFGVQSGFLVQRMQKLGWTFQLCRYEENSQLAFVHSILDRMRREAREPRNEESPHDHFGKVLGRSLYEVWQIAAFIKNRGFKEEREVRFLSPPISGNNVAVKFRAGKYTLVPYLNFPLAELEAESIHFDEVILGPTPAGFLSEMAVENFLKQKAVTVQRGVRLSEVPYREL